MNLVLRIISAVVLLPLVLFLLHRGGTYTLAFMWVTSTICLLEYTGIVAKDDAPSRALALVTGSLAVWFGMWTSDAVVALLALHAPTLALVLWFTLRTGDDFDTTWRRLAVLALGVPYVGLGMMSVYRLRALGEGLDAWAAPTWVYVALLATWSNDTFAYFAGRAFGKHKLYEKVSPKKTWEGFVGGGLGAIGMLLAAKAALPQAFAHIAWVDLLLIGVPAAALAPLGDLAESLLKRNYGVKDSGRSIPGHGGMLDRVDALLLVAPWVLLYVKGIRPLLTL